MRKPFTSAAILSFTFCFHLAIVAYGQKNDSLKIKEVVAQQAAFANTIMQTRWSELSKFLADEAMYVHSFGRVDTKAELIKNISRFKACRQWENRNITVYVHKDIAIVHSNLFVTLTLPDGTEQVSQQRATDVWVMKKGEWLLQAHQSTSFK